MDGIKVGIILSRDEWKERVTNCNTISYGDHLIVTSGSVLPVTRGLNIEPPFYCYSILRKEFSLNGSEKYQWVHVCFLIGDAGKLGAHADERYSTALELKRKELEQGKEQRIANLAADLEAEESEEDLGVIDMERSTQILKEDRLLYGGKKNA